MKYAPLLTAVLAIATPMVSLFPLGNAIAQQSPDTVPEGYQTVRGDRWSFAIPQPWQATQYPQPGIGNVSLIAQYESPNGDVFVNLVTEPFAGDTESYLTLNRQSMETFGFTIHSQRSTPVGTLAGAELESSVPTQPSTRVLQRLVADNENGYVLTCRTTEATFEQYRDQCAQIVNTFQVLP